MLSEIKRGGGSEAILHGRFLTLALLLTFNSNLFLAEACPPPRSIRALPTLESKRYYLLTIILYEMKLPHQD
jgi:hypothetical protein